MNVRFFIYFAGIILIIQKIGIGAQAQIAATIIGVIITVAGLILTILGLTGNLDC